MDLDDSFAPPAHGGDLGAARAMFPHAPEPFLDLSTGINPHPYPLPDFPPGPFTKLPERPALAGLRQQAAAAYGAPSPAHLVIAPGTQILMSLVAASLPPGRAAILGPTYAEHARATALAGHDVAEVSSLDALAGTEIAVVVNPNNPDGRMLPQSELLTLAKRLGTHGGLLVVDEAFMDAEHEAESLCGAVEHGNIVVLRSFGKFYGLPGLRLSFAITAPERATQLAAALGPWPVSDAALSIGAKALADRAWKEKTRARLHEASRRLDEILRSAGLEIVGGTALFHLVRTPQAGELFRHLGEAGVLVRRFDYAPDWLRFGLPGDERDWQRLITALASFAKS